MKPMVERQLPCHQTIGYSFMYPVPSYIWLVTRANCIKLLVWPKTCYVFFFFLSSFNWLTIYYHVLLQLINHILSRLRLSTICPLIRTKTIFKLGIIKLIFCCTDNRESYFESVGRGNSKNLTFQNREIVDSGF